MRTIIVIAIVFAAAAAAVLACSSADDSSSDQALCEKQCEKMDECQGSDFAKEFTTLEDCKNKCDPAVQEAECKKEYCADIEDPTYKKECEENCSSDYTVADCKEDCQNDEEGKSACEARCEKEFGQECKDALGTAYDCAMGLSCDEIQGIYDKEGSFAGTSCESDWKAALTACGETAI